MAGKKGVLDLIINKLHMSDDEDGGYYDDDEDDPYYDGASASESSFGRQSSSKADLDDRDDDRAAEKPVKKAPAGVMSAPAKRFRRSGSTMNAGGMEVRVIKPASFEEASDITDTLLSNMTVVLNLEGLDLDIAQRIIDFTFGSTYAVSGNLQKISRYIFVITPASVDISGDFQELISGTISQGGPQLSDR